MSQYYGVQVEPHAVRGWSNQRLPFEPKGWLKDYREDLRQALRSLFPEEGTHLRAIYACPDREFADVENVLLYNIGSGNYRHLTGSGLEVLRIASPDGLHHASYQLTASSADELSRGEIMATVSLDSLPSHREEPGAWWAAMRGRVSTSGRESRTEYTIEVRSRGQVSPIVSSVKPMLDGLTSALHVHDGSHGDHVRAALARHDDPNELWELLNDPATSILGRRTLVRPHGRAIAWNPADHLCSGFSIMQSPSGPMLQATVRSTQP